MATATLHERLMEDVQSLVIGLNLTGSSGATGSVGQNVAVQWQEERLDLPAYPAVVVSCQGEAEDVTTELSTSEYKGTTYPVRVLIVDQARTDFQAARLDYLAWRKSIRDALHEKGNVPVPPATVPPLLPNSAECAYVRVRPLKTSERAPKVPLVVSGAVAECFCTETR